MNKKIKLDSLSKTLNRNFVIFYIVVYILTFATIMVSTYLVKQKVYDVVVYVILVILFVLPFIYLHYQRTLFDPLKSIPKELKQLNK